MGPIMGFRLWILVSLVMIILITVLVVWLVARFSKKRTKMKN